MRGTVTPFSALRDIAVGDDIYIDTARGSVHYRVTSTAVVHPRDLSVIADTPQTTLTLITCYPFWVFGPAPDRFIVRATRVGEPPSLLPSVTSTGT